MTLPLPGFGDTIAYCIHARDETDPDDPSKLFDQAAAEQHISVITGEHQHPSPVAELEDASLPQEARSSGPSVLRRGAESVLDFGRMAISGRTGKLFSDALRRGF